MLNPSAFSTAALAPGGAHSLAPPATAAQPRRAAAHGARLKESPGDDDTPIEWTEEDDVLLHWRLLVEVRRLSDPETPLEERYDTLRWIFTGREKDAKPFSFVSCLRVVGCSPLSPIAYCGRLDAEELRDHISHCVKAWLGETLMRYPAWVREAIASLPGWLEANLARNPRWINEQLKHMSADGDLFA